jgi:hypothetical protein
MLCPTFSLLKKGIIKGPIAIEIIIAIPAASIALII